MKACIFKFVLAACLSSSLSLKADEEKTLSFLLPVNWVFPNKINLMVTIPENFVSVQPMDAWMDSPLIEFIPKGEDVNAWSQIITVNKFIGKQYSAVDLTDMILKNLIEKTSRNEVWSNKKSDETAYKTASFGLTYVFDDKKEVIGAHYYSGPYDCVGVQYTIRPKKDSSENATIDTITSYFDNNVRI